MPAEIDTGGPRVLHCDSRADCPTTPNRVPIIAVVGRIANRAYTDCRRIVASTLAVSVRASSANVPNTCAEGRPGSPAGGDDDDDDDAASRARNRALTQPSRQRRRDEDRLERTVPRAGIGNVFKDERPSFARNCRVDASARDKVAERAESRLRDETERFRHAVAARSGRSIARRRNHRDRGWTRPRVSGRGGRGGEAPDTDRGGPIGHPERTRAAGGSPLLSSHRWHTRTEKGSRLNGTEETPSNSERSPGERYVSEDARIGENARLAYLTGGDARRTREEVQIERIGRESVNSRRIKRARRARSFLRLAILLFLVAFGRNGPLGSSVLRFSAGRTACGLSVLAIGSTIIGAVSATPVDLIGDAGVRAERSANLSHITGASRKIQMYIKHRHLQILPDGTVNGSNDDTSEYTIFQRTSVSRGQLRIQGVATCLYLCMDSCGLLYGSREYTEDCVFNETLEQHNYNTYSSVRWSTAKKTLYLGLNRRGQPRRVQTKGHNLGRLSAYARVLTQVAPPDRVEALQRRMLGGQQHNVRHRHHGHGHHRQHGDVAQQQQQQSICPIVPPQEKDGRDRFRCRKRKKRKKRKRRCRPGERPGPQCQVPEDYVVAGTTSETTGADVPSPGSSGGSSTTPESKRSCEGAASEEACRRQALSVPAEKRKSRIDGDPTAAVVHGRNLTLNGKNKAPTSNAKKPNVGGDSQSKKPDLTDGKKRKRMGPPAKQLRGSTVPPPPPPPPSRKRYALGVTGLSRASSPLTAPAASEVRVTTASSSSSPSRPGASTATSGRKAASPPSGRKMPPPPPPPPSSRNHVTRPVGSRRVGKSFPGYAGSPGRSRSTPPASAVPRNGTARRDPPSTTKVPETTTPPPPPSSLAPSLSWRESAEDPPTSLSGSPFSPVHEEPISFAASEFTTGTVTESVASIASSEVIAGPTTTFRPVEEDEDVDERSPGVADTIPRATTTLPFEGLAM